MAQREKLEGHKEEIEKMILDLGMTDSQIAEAFEVHRITVLRFRQKHNIKSTYRR